MGVGEGRKGERKKGWRDGGMNGRKRDGGKRGRDGRKKGVKGRRAGKEEESGKKRGRGVRILSSHFKFF